MLVQPFNFNVADERPIEYGLSNLGVPCYRCEWQTTLKHVKLGPERRLLYTPSDNKKDFEVSVIYYRAGYDAAEYADEVGRTTRILLESSRAIKCPDILTHMAGFKSVQQAFTEEGAVRRFLASNVNPDESKRLAESVRATFMPMYALSGYSPDGLLAREIANDPLRAIDYVLKPNLEGGGNNVFRSDIPEFLARVPEAEWHEYTLMRLIEPPVGSKGVLLTANEVYEGPVVSELGILGFATWRRQAKSSTKGKAKAGQAVEVEILRNEAAGWTFKTKPKSVDEMSVVKGYGCFDCPLLT